MFSVIIPLYNKEISILNTVNSVLEQTFKNFEIIIVNDGSTDNSLNLIQTLEDPRIKVIDQLNAGVSMARNRGIKESKFEWITFLDADDLWKSIHLETLKNLIDYHNEDKVFCTSFVRSNERVKDSNDTSVFVIDDYFREAIKESFFWTSVTCIHKSVFGQVGVFPKGISRGEDLDLWQRIGRDYRFIKSNRVTAIYRIDSENKLTTSSFDYKKSALSLDHKRVRYFTRQSEKDYHISTLKRYVRTFLMRLDFKSAIKTLNKLIFMLFKPVKHD
ncbi:glycosyltransferase family 2 protein [Sphingobacterium suaedae]|uniref:Glycosyltransferase family 2 protein n=1 Tax=Sphingobacterium suaedae TaxID=1686402 RepID=A0ABW5KNR0_9SPHI